ncbi:Abscission/NoCut checkpoint regulator [Tulasnella sp. UAMH 9824]|nr:Abscission/NoCut checkpoint regulator [Tulasnella sp. UAMH 9824]
MESDSESELLWKRFEQLKAPLQAPGDAAVKPQVSPTTARFDRAALDADLRKRLQELGSESGTEVDDEELEKMLQSEDEYLEEIFPTSRLAEVRHIVTQLQGSRPSSRQSSQAPMRRDSNKTISASNMAQQYSADSDADDESAADELVRRVRDQLALEGHSRSNSSNSSRAASVEAAEYDRDGEDDEDDDDTNSSTSLKGGETGQRTPPSKPRSLLSSAKIEMNRYQSLLQNLETPRSLPAETPTSEGEPLPAVFAKLQSISPNTAKIGVNRGKEDVHDGPSTDSKSDPSDLGPAPALDIEGWRAAKDNKPEEWCCICNADAEVSCPGCDKDLYCKKCYAEGHPSDAADAGEHKPVDYTPSTPSLP